MQYDARWDNEGLMQDKSLTCLVTINGIYICACFLIARIIDCCSWSISSGGMRSLCPSSFFQKASSSFQWNLASPCHLNDAKSLHCLLKCQCLHRYQYIMYIQLLLLYIHKHRISYHRKSWDLEATTSLLPYTWVQDDTADCRSSWHTPIRYNEFSK